MLPEMTIAIMTLLSEGSICGEQELMMIARVMQIRAEERKLTLRQVCLQHRQFSCWNGCKAKRKILKAYRAGLWKTETWKRCRRVAAMIYTGDLDHLPRWNHYYNPKLASPSWAPAMKNKHYAEYHVFGRLTQ